MNHSACGQKKEKMRLISSIFVGLILSVAAFAQMGTDVQGTVKDRRGPVAGAKVTIRLAGDDTVTYSTVTDQNGRYHLSPAQAGEYDVSAEFSQNGANAISKSERIRVLFESTVNADLFVESYRPINETVTVSADRSQPIEQVSKTVDVITAQEMRDRADFTLIELLRSIPGFRVAQSGGFGRVASIKTRGLRNQDTAILVDGIRFRDASGISGDATSFLSDFTLTSVSKVEVLRGSGSSLYGTNAVGGTVDFQTPRAPSGTHGQIGGAIGGLGLGRFRGNLSHGTEDGNFGITGGVSRTAYTKGIDGEDNAANTNVQTRVELDPFSRTNISGRIFFSDANVRLNSSPDTLGPLPASNSTVIDAKNGANFISDANDPDARQKSRFFLGQIQLNQSINDHVALSGYYQGLSTRRDNTNGILGTGFQSASTSTFEGKIHTGNVKLTWSPIAENDLSVGYEFESEDFGNDGRTPSGTGNFFTKSGQRSNTFYFQNLAKLLKQKLTLAGGFRVQQYSLDRPEFSLTNAPYNNLTLDNPPTAYTVDGAASYSVQKSGTKIRAHVGNGYRVPSLYERFGTFFSTFPTARFVAIGDPFLKPEKTIAFDAGVDQTILNGSARLSATYFYTKLNDTIGFGNVVPNIGTTTRPFGGYENQKGGIARGAEFSANAKPTATANIFASYTFTNSDQRRPQISGSRNISTLGVPENQFTLVATQRFGRAWVNFDFLATSSYLAPIFSNSNFTTYLYRFDGNRKGDLTGGYTFGFKQEKLTLRVYGTIENIFNQEYFENGFRTAKATARIGSAFAF